MIKRPIYVFVRHCGISSNSVNKIRPEWFSKEKAFANLMRTKDEDTHIYVMLDTASINGTVSSHFTIQYEGVHMVPMYGGTDAHSFINMINYVCNMKHIIPEDAIVYLLEDDYVHKKGWCDTMREVFDTKIADYATLYDHSDKYDKSMYNGLKSELYVTKSCHWRTTPSTTNTYAMLFSTLLKSKEDHLRFSSKEVGFTFDHAKFTYLHSIGKKLVSSVPGLSTHVEYEYLSPTVDWEQVINGDE